MSLDSHRNLFLNSLSINNYWIHNINSAACTERRADRENVFRTFGYYADLRKRIWARKPYVRFTRVCKKRRARHNVHTGEQKGYAVSMLPIRVFFLLVSSRFCSFISFAFPVQPFLPLFASSIISEYACMGTITPVHHNFTFIFYFHFHISILVYFRVSPLDRRSLLPSFPRC